MADLADQIQSELQQQEEAVLHARANAQEAVKEALGAAAGAGPRQDSYEAAVAEALRRANDRGVTSKDRGEASVLVAVTSACCTEAALERRAAIRATWGRDIREVRCRYNALQQPARSALL